jgi:signal transduction histidine kinase
VFRDPGHDYPGDTYCWAAHNPRSKRMGRYRTIRRALVHRVLRASIATAIAIAAVTASLLTSLTVPAAVAVVVGVTAAVAGQAIRERLERAADRWVLGSRLAGYANLNRFGRSLIQAPGSAGLLSDLAGEIRRGLGLTWARVSLDAADGPLRVAADGTPTGDPADAVPIEYHGAVLGRIECGPRSDGPLLAEDRRLLAYFAAQAAVGVHNLHLAAELSRRIEEIRDQAAELEASRARVVAAQDAERRRIQRVLHDGVQQEIVALSARAGLVRQQLLRGDPAAAGGLTDMQRDLATTLQDVREIAYAIHPPVLSDRGLLEAIEAQSSRLALPMVVRAHPRLRGVRFGEQIEVTAWYVLAEALSSGCGQRRCSLTSGCRPASAVPRDGPAWRGSMRRTRSGRRTLTPASWSCPSTPTRAMRSSCSGMARPAWPTCSRTASVRWAACWKRCGRSSTAGP